ETATLQEPDEEGFWIIGFTDVPWTKQGEDYTLEVKSGNTVLATVGGLRVLGSYGIGITYPSSNSTVCPVFGAYGPRDEAGTVTCKLVKTGSPDVSGTVMEYSGMWAASFSGVSLATYDKLTATVGMSTASHDTITVANVSR